MASYGAYPPPPPPPNQYPPPPPPPPQSQPSQQRVPPVNQYPPGQSYNNAHPMQNPPPAPPSSSFQHYGQYPSSFPPPPLPPPSPPPPPPPPDSSYPPPPPPPASSYYPSSQYSQFVHAPPPPPPPSSPPPSAPPPPPPSGKNTERRPHNNSSSHRHQVQQQKPPLAAAKKPNGGRVESEEERMRRKKREMEKLRHDEKHKQQLKEHNSISNIHAVQKNQALSSSKGGGHGHGSIVGSRMGERRSAPILSSDRGENRLKKPTTFLCKMKFRNELPDPSAQPKLMAFPKDPERFTRYSITSLEKSHKPELYVEPDLGIPLDLLDLSVYNPPKVVPPLDPEDEELLRDDEEVTPIKKEGIRKKERPTDTGMSWLVKTQYISPLSNDAAKLSLTEKQAKELREKKGGKDILDNFNSRERKIQSIEASFEAAKLRPVHQTKPNLEPVEILPLFPDFDRCNEQFVVATFDSAPTADSELSKLDMNIRREQESRAIMKSYVAQGSDPSKAEGEKFLAYMIPKPDELSKDMLDPHEDVSYSWVREYHWDIRKEDAEDPTTYLVSFDEDEARYLPLPTKLLLGKKKAREGRSDDAEQFPVPAGVTVRWRPTVSATEMKDVPGTSKGGYSNSKRRSDVENDMDEDRKLSPEMVDQYSGAEDDLSD